MGTQTKLSDLTLVEVLNFDFLVLFFWNLFQQNMADKSEPEEQPRFLEGEKIFCFHGPLIYEAKIQKVESKNKQTKYFIHYHGWNKNWDEWVPEARMLKYTEMNKEKKRDLVKAQEATARSKKNAV